MSMINEGARKVLYWNSSTDFSITDENGDTLTPAEAKRHYLSYNIRDCNAAFNRLADHDFDVDRAKASYDD